MALFKRGKEEEVKFLIFQHMGKVKECLDRTQKMIEFYLKGNIDEAKKEALNTDNLETEADYFRRAIVEKLYQGAFLPIFRVDIHNFTEKMDFIADNAEYCCDFFLGQRPQIPDQYQEVYLKIIKDTLPMFLCLKEATENFFSKGDYPLIRQRVKEISVSESAIDDEEWKLTRNIFTYSLTLAEKIHLKQCLGKVTIISDQIEDTSDWLEALIISKKI